jgi:hypothetical protein
MTHRASSRLHSMAPPSRAQGIVSRSTSVTSTKSAIAMIVRITTVAKTRGVSRPRPPRRAPWPARSGDARRRRELRTRPRARPPLLAPGRQQTLPRPPRLAPLGALPRRSAAPASRRDSRRARRATESSPFERNSAVLVALPPENDIDGLECDVVSRALSDSYLRTTSVWVIRSCRPRLRRVNAIISRLREAGRRGTSRGNERELAPRIGAFARGDERVRARFAVRPPEVRADAWPSACGAGSPEQGGGSRRGRRGLDVLRGLRRAVRMARHFADQVVGRLVLCVVPIELDAQQTSLN